MSISLWSPGVCKHILNSYSNEDTHSYTLHAHSLWHDVIILGTDLSDFLTSSPYHDVTVETTVFIMPVAPTFCSNIFITLIHDDLQPTVINKQTSPTTRCKPHPLLVQDIFKLVQFFVFELTYFCSVSFCIIMFLYHILFLYFVQWLYICVCRWCPYRLCKPSAFTLSFEIKPIKTKLN